MGPEKAPAHRVRLDGDERSFLSLGACIDLLVTRGAFRPHQDCKVRAPSHILQAVRDDLSGKRSAKEEGQDTRGRGRLHVQDKTSLSF